MKLAAIIAMLICGAQSSLAGKRISVAQLDEMLRLAQEGGKADAQIARSLAGVELTERTTESVRTRLLSRLQGPRARDVLDILAEVSAFLDGPTELQAPGEQPSAAQQNADSRDRSRIRNALCPHAPGFRLHASDAPFRRLP